MPFLFDIQSPTAVSVCARLQLVLNASSRDLRDLSKHKCCKWQPHIPCKRTSALLFRGVSVGKTMAALKCSQSLDLESLSAPVSSVLCLL